MKFCPQCATPFDPGARFCHKCGFDKSIYEPFETPTSDVSMNDAKVKPSEQEELTTKPPETKKNCSQCGGALDPGDRFCPECGFDTSIDCGIAINKFAAVEQPDKIHPPLPDNNQPEFETVPLPMPDTKFEQVILPETATTQIPEPSPSISPAIPIAHKKRKKSWLRIVVVVIGLGILGTAGWYRYDSYMNNSDEISSDTFPDTQFPISPDVENTFGSEKSGETSAVPQKTNAKPVSKMEQEPAKQKAKEPGREKSSPDQDTKPDPGIQVLPDPDVNVNTTRVLLEVGRKEEPKSKNPRNPTMLSIRKPTMIVRITTDHYNDGMGTAGGGTISIKDHDGNTIAAFKAYGRTGINGTPGAKWVCEPNKVLHKGTYYIWDSDMATWSKNFLGTGFVLVEGYEAE